MQTLHAGCSKVEPKDFRLAADPLPGGAGQPKFNQLETVTTCTYQTQFGEDRCMQFQVIMVTDPQTNTPANKQTHKQDRLQYTVPLSLAQCNYVDILCMKVMFYVYIVLLCRQLHVLKVCLKT